MHKVRDKFGSMNMWRTIRSVKTKHDLTISLSQAQTLTQWYVLLDEINKTKHISFWHQVNYYTYIQCMLCRIYICAHINIYSIKYAFSIIEFYFIYEWIMNILSSWILLGYRSINRCKKLSNLVYLCNSKIIDFNCTNCLN